MASTTTYGDFPGVKVTTAGGAITGIAVGREQKLYVVGVGDQPNASASVNTVTEVKSRIDADNKFGEGSELAENVRDAIDNGANLDFLYGVMVDETSVTSETFTSASSGTLANNPIIEDLSTITVRDTVDSVDATVEFRYDSPPSPPSNTDTVHINPMTGEWEADSSSDYDFDYSYPTYDTALVNVFDHTVTEETGIVNTLAEAGSVASNLSGKLNTARSSYKMYMGLQTAEPNANDSDSPPDADYDTANYTDNIDNDAMFLHAPGRKKDDKHVMSGAIAGVMAGNPLNDSIYNDQVTLAEDLEQKLSDPEPDELEGEEVIPIVQKQDGGEIRIARNLSTSTATDWERDYWRKRIVDQVVLIAKAVGDAVIGRINDQRTRDTVESQITSELRGLAQDRLIEPNTQDGTKWFVDVYEVDADTVGVDIGVTPQGIAKRVETNITINA